MAGDAAHCDFEVALRGHGSEMTTRRRAGGVPCSRKMGYGLPEVPQLRLRTLVRRKSLDSILRARAMLPPAGVGEGEGYLVVHSCVVYVQASELCMLKSCPACSRVSLFLSCFGDTVRIVHHRPV